MIIHDYRSRKARLNFLSISSASPTTDKEHCVLYLCPYHLENGLDYPRTSLLPEGTGGALS